jgi:hypothetical protein
MLREAGCIEHAYVQAEFVGAGRRLRKNRFELRNLGPFIENSSHGPKY